MTDDKNEEQGRKMVATYERINRALADEFGEKPDDVQEYISGLTMYLGIEMAHYCNNGVTLEEMHDAMFSVIKMGFDVGQKAREEMKLQSRKIIS